MKASLRLLRPAHVVVPRVSAAALLALLAVPSGASAQTSKKSPAATATVEQRAIRTLAAPPLSFEENGGQADARVKFFSRGKGYALALTQEEAILAVAKRKPTADSSQSTVDRQDARGSKATEPAMLRMRFAGGNTVATVEGVEPLPGKVYYVTDERIGPLVGNRTFRRVRYAGVYPGIDTVYHGDNDRLEFDFVVAPHADPNQIRLAFSGADQIALAHNGDLVLHVAGEEVRLQKPLIYQEHDGARHEISGGFLLHDDATATFAVGDYDPALPLVIDPVWILASQGEDTLVAMEADSTGAPHVLGTSFDPATLPFTLIAIGVLPAPNCFLAKLDAATGLPSYLIVFRNMQNCQTLAISPNDIMYFTGHSLLNPRATIVASVTDSGGGPTLNYFAVSNYDSSAIGQGVSAMAVNSLEHIFLLGPCRLVDSGDPPLMLSGFNTTPNAANGTFAEACTAPPPPGLASIEQMLLTVVDNTGNFLYGSFLSPDELPVSVGLTADDADHAYIVGSNLSTLAVTADAYLSTCPAPAVPTAVCSYLMVLDTTTGGPSSLRYGSYLWNLQDIGERIAVRVGPAGEVFIATSGRVFVTAADGLTPDFPNNRPTPPYPCNAPCFPNVTEGLQLARFDLDLNGMPNVLHFALLEGPLLFTNGLGREDLMDLRLLPSGAPVLTSVGHDGFESRALYRVFYPSGELRALLGDLLLDFAPAQPKLLQAVDVNGIVFLAHQTLRHQAGDSDIRVADLSFITGQPFTDPGANTPPAFSANDVTVQAPDNVGTVVTGFNYFVYDAEDFFNVLGGCDRMPGQFFPVGTTTVNCTFTDSGGLSASFSFDVIVLGNSADLEIRASGSPDPLNTGDTLDYVVSAKNNGPAPATNVLLTYVMPGNVVFEGTSSRQGFGCTGPAVGSSGTVTCDFGTLASGGIGAVSIKVKPQAAGALSSLFSVAATEPDPDATNNAITITTTVNLAPAVINVAENIVVTDTPLLLPSAMVGVSENIIVTDAPNVLPSAMIGVNENIVVTDSPGVIAIASDLAITKFLDRILDSTGRRVPEAAGRVDNGGLIEFNIHVANVGTIPFTSAFTVSDTLPAGLTFIPFGTPCSAAGQVVTCVLDFSTPSAAPFPPNTLLAFHIPVQVGNVAAPGQPLTLTNTATLTVPGDPNPQNQNNVSSVSFTVTDLTPPVISACGPLANLGANAAGQASMPDVTSQIQATDNWPGSLSITQNPAAGTLLGIGTYPVDITVTDAEGNSSSCQTSINVQDVTPPTLTLPANIRTEATSSSGAVVNYTATADDGLFGPLTPSCAPPSGSTFPVGNTTVNCDAADAAGNRASGSFIVTVQDTTPPVLTLPANITVTSSSAANVSYTATAADLVSGSITPVCVPASGALFAIGTTPVNCTATDGAGNSATGSFTVTVQAPTPPFPPPSLFLPGNITVLATSASGAVVTYTATAQVAAFGGPVPVPVSCTPASGSTFPIGTTTVTCIARNPFAPGFLTTSATGSFTVTVNVGAPSLLAIIAAKGRDAAGNFFVDLQLANGGTGHARNVSLDGLVFRTLAGTGAVTFNAALSSGPLPLAIGSIDAGTTRTIRLFLNVPLTVRYFSITESGSLQDVIGAQFKFSLAHSVFP